MNHIALHITPRRMMTFATDRRMPFQPHAARRGRRPLAALLAAALLAGGCGGGEQWPGWDMLATVQSWGPSQTWVVSGQHIDCFDNYDAARTYLRLTEGEADLIRDALENIPPHLLRTRWVATLPGEFMPRPDSAAGAGEDGFWFYVHDGKAGGATAAKVHAYASRLAVTAVHENDHLYAGRDEALWQDLHRRSGDDPDNFAYAYGMSDWREDSATVAEMWAGGSADFIERAAQLALQHDKPLLLEKILAKAGDFALAGEGLWAYAPVRSDGYLQPEIWPVETSPEGWVRLGPYVLIIEPAGVTGLLRTEHNEALGQEVLLSKWRFLSPIRSERVQELAATAGAPTGPLVHVEDAPVIDSRYTGGTFDALYAALLDAATHRPDALAALLDTASWFIDPGDGVLTAYAPEADGAQTVEWELIAAADASWLRAGPIQLELADGEIVGFMIAAESADGAHAAPGYRAPIPPLASTFVSTALAAAREVTLEIAEGANP